CGGALRVRGAADARAVAVLLEVADAGRGAARGTGGGDVVGGAIVADAVAELVDIADTSGGPADGGALGVRRAVVGHGVADLVDGAATGAWPAGGGALRVGRAVDARAVAVLLEVADAGREAAWGAAAGDVIGGAIVGDAVADVVEVADTGGGPADGGALDVRRAVDGRAVAILLEVTHAGRETAGSAAGGDIIGGAIVGDTVADLVDVADTGGGPADGGALDVRRAVDARAVAVLIEVADAGREAARGAGAGDVIGGAIVGDTVADLVDVADTGGGPADGGTLGVGRAVDPRAVAVFLQVTHAGRQTAGGAGRGDVIGRAVVGDAVADLRDVADTGGGPARRGALGVRGAVDRRPVAVFLEVTDAGRETAGGAGGGNVISGAVVADAVAALRHVADAAGRAADRRALGVVRARGARPGARLRKVADAGGRPARGAAGNEAVGRTAVADAI